MEEDNKIKETVRTIYGNVASETSAGRDCGNTISCCGASAKPNLDYATDLGYSVEDANQVPPEANMGLGCGNPTAIANLKPGEIVLDLGSGGGFDCFLAAKKVGPLGKVIGVDMTPAMISKARLNAEKGNYSNVEFRLGEIENLPVADSTIDVIISNCVINLSTYKKRVIQEAYRVLKIGGRLAISDIIANRPLPESVKKDLELYAGCVAGAMAVDELSKILDEAGFENINIRAKEASRTFIKKWLPESSAEKHGTAVEEFVASANIEAVKGCGGPKKCCG
jgi:SAM-dependent methyltransferase